MSHLPLDLDLKSPAPSGRGLPKSASRPILIAPEKTPRSAHVRKAKEKPVAHSCPTTLSLEPPRAPSVRPRVPSIDPPLMSLPPSPPVFTTLQAEEAQKQATEIRKTLTRSLQTYSSSLPTHLAYLSSSYQPDMDHLEELADEDVEEEAAAELLGKSPTIFSLLRTDAFSGVGSLGATGAASFGHSAMATPARPARPAAVSISEQADFEGEGDGDMSDHSDNDELQFNIQLDDGPEDGDDAQGDLSLSSEPPRTTVPPSSLSAGKPQASPQLPFDFPMY